MIIAFLLFYYIFHIMLKPFKNTWNSHNKLNVALFPNSMQPPNSYTALIWPSHVYMPPFVFHMSPPSYAHCPKSKWHFRILISLNNDHHVFKWFILHHSILYQTMLFLFHGNVFNSKWDASRIKARQVRHRMKTNRDVNPQRAQPTYIIVRMIRQKKTRFWTCKQLLLKSHLHIGSCQ